MRNTWTRALLAAAALAVSAGMAQAQPANCRDINNDGLVNATDGTALENRLINPSFPICGGAGIDCADINESGSVDPGDRFALARSLAGEDLVYRPCTGPAAVTCPGGNVTGNLTANTHWGPAGCTVNLAGLVLVAPPAVLTVDPGVVVRGVRNPANPAALVVTRGAKLDANGTAANPIVFTSNQAPGGRAAADWGGVTLNGSAPVNFPGGEGSAEGLPPGFALYGGPDVTDSSGRVRFTRVEFSGIEFTENNELNVFTMNGVGSGTTIDHVQAHRGNDDCHEWFGGTVDTKFLVSTACRDDDFDWQIGWTGSLQFGLSHKSTLALTDGSGRNGFESDNNEFGFDNLPRANPTVCNVTSIGARPQGTAITGAGANLRRGTAGTISNSILMHWPSGCLDLDNDETLNRACVPGPALRTGADVLLVQDTICYDNGAGGAAQITGSTTAPNCTASQAYGLWAASQGLVPAAANTQGPNPNIAAAATFPTNPITPNNWVPSPAIAGPNCEAVDPAAFDSAPFMGAFNTGFAWLGDSAPCNPGQVSGCWISVDLN